MDPTSHFNLNNELEWVEHFKDNPGKIQEHIDDLYKTETSFTTQLSDALTNVSTKVAGLFTPAASSPSSSATATFSRSSEGKKETAKVIAKAEEILNKQNKSLLDEIIKNKDAAKLNYLVKNGFDINRVNEKGETYLTQAIRTGKHGAVEFLIGNGADINKPNASGELPLRLAVILMPDRVVTLIQKGADVLKEVGDHACPLSLIFYTHHVHALNELFTQGFDFHATDSSGKNIALNNCANDAVALFLLQKGIGSKLSIAEKTKLFFNFIDKGFNEVSSHLVKEGIDLNTVKDWDGYSKGHNTFMYAVHHGVYDAARAIFQQDPTHLERTDANARNIFLQVVSEGFDTQQINFLLDLGCDPSLKDLCGWTAMDYCFSRVFNDSVESKKEVLEKMLSKHKNLEEFIRSLPLNASEREHLLKQLAENPFQLAEPKNQEIIADAIESKMTRRVVHLSSAPIDSGTLEACKRLRQTVPPIADVAHFAQKEPQGFQKLQEKRMGLSTTLGWTHNLEAMKRWSAGDNRIRELALRKQPVTKEILCQLNAMINDNEGGRVRQRGSEVGTGFMNYVRGHTVEKQLDELLDWIDRAVVECDQGHMDPIVVAAHVYQRMVSLHPFNDANGRTTRYLMDYVLQRNGLPPASLDDCRVAVFALAVNNFSSTQAVERVRAGVEESYRLLNIEVRS